MTLPNFGIPDPAATAVDLAHVSSDNARELSTVVNALADETAGAMSAGQRDLARVQNAVGATLRAASKRNVKALSGVFDPISAHLSAAQANAHIQMERVSSATGGNYSVWQSSYVDGSGIAHVHCYYQPDGKGPQSTGDLQLTQGQTLADASAYTDQCNCQVSGKQDCGQAQNATPSAPPPLPPLPSQPLPSTPAIPWKPPSLPHGPRATPHGTPCGPKRDCWILPVTFSVWHIP